MFYDSYTLERIGSFDSIPYNELVSYEVKIFKKNGVNIRPSTLVFGKNPIVIRTLNDDVFGIKGTECELTLININNVSPLSSFYSDEDDTYKIEVTATYTPTPNPQLTKTIFTGFLIQEDCSEVLEDWGHEIKLSFSDGLGTLKNVPFGDAAMTSPTSAANVTVVDRMIQCFAEGPTESQKFVITQRLPAPLQVVGKNLILLDSPVGTSSYNIKASTLPTPFTPTLYFTDPYQIFGPASCKIAFVTASDPYSRITLADVLRICLHATNVNLNLRFFNILQVVISGSGQQFLTNTYIDGRTFLQDQNNWKDCYTILDELCKRFQMSIFQQDGIWYIVRWNELRYLNNNLFYIEYDGYFNVITSGYIGDKTLNTFENGLEEGFLRPYNYYRDTLNYKINTDNLQNRTAQELGLKINEYADTLNGNPVTVYEYEWDKWTGNPTPGGAVYKPFIRIIKDSLNQEIERYMGSKLVSGTITRINNDSSYAIEAKKIECIKGDRVKFSFDIRNNDDPSGNIKFVFKLTDGTSTYLLSESKDENGRYKWLTTSNGFDVFTILSGSYRTYEFDCQEFPISGLLTFYLGFFAFTDTNKITYYKNIEFEYIPYVNQLSIVKGHQHTASQFKVIKNNFKQEIFIDDTQKNAIYGTLFLNSFTNLIQNRTNNWFDGINNFALLGEITTLQMEDWRCRIRTKLEGKILGIINSNSEWLALYNPYNFALKNGKYFIFGKAEYNLKEDFIEATLYEMWASDEDRSVTGILGNTALNYDFKFLYK